MKQSAIILISIIAFFGCNPKDKFSYQIVITDIPANMKSLNSGYDDYNSDLSYDSQRYQINFSSNRNSAGGNFDIVGHPLDFSYHQEDDILNLSIPNDFAYRDTALLSAINTDENEFGPFSFISGQSRIFMYASNSTANGEYDIKFVENTKWSFDWADQTISLPKNVAAIGKFKDDLYPSLSQDGTDLYFCSNFNDTVFNIYKADFKTQIDAYQLENNSAAEVSKDIILSSIYNDKCPFINAGFMVFASDRKGGFGGYDLWYSYYRNNTWTEPINFGNKINTEYDEFRPITLTVVNYDIMIFSSNRPGGIGGFDLYVVKVSDMIN